MSIDAPPWGLLTDMGEIHYGVPSLALTIGQLAITVYDRYGLPGKKLLIGYKPDCCRTKVNTGYISS
jgi:hypothetical protein